MKVRKEEEEDEAEMVIVTSFSMVVEHGFSFSLVSLSLHRVRGQLYSAALSNVHALCSVGREGSLGI